MHRIWDLVSLLTARRLLTRKPSGSAIFLTFDDGPNPEHTPALLRVLAQHGVSATFFLEGRNVEKHPQIVAQLVAAGHVIGNHSYAHPSFPSQSLRRQLQEIATTDALLARFDGRKHHAFRPPHGRATLGTVLLCLLRGQRLVLWTHDSFDFRTGASEIVARFRELPLRAGDILLFHDDGPQSRIALEQLIPAWRTAGFEFGRL
jgi:peptidoglycan/xylan/chitin deacetylase (PgdA/CDA1 family)